MLQLFRKQTGGGTGAPETDPVAKPLIDAHQAATDAHGDRAYADTRIAALVNAAPSALDTLAEIDAQMASDESGAAAMQASLNGKAIKPVVGTLAAMPAVGTGSMQFYVTDVTDQGGTIYQDQTPGGPYTKIAPGVGQIAGQELAYAEINANVTTNALGLANRVDAGGLIVTAAVGSRPVLVEFFGSVFNTVINDGVGIQIVEAAAGNANNTPIRNQSQMISAGIAAAITPFNLRVRLNPVAGNYTWKVMFNATVGGTATISASATQPAFLRVISG